MKPAAKLKKSYRGKLWQDQLIKITSKTSNVSIANSLKYIVHHHSKNMTHALIKIAPTILQMSTTGTDASVLNGTVNMMRGKEL